MRILLRTAMLAAIPFTPLRPVPAPMQAESVIERTLAASNGERISIDLRPGGSVTIHGWSQPRVRLRAVLSGNQSRQTRVMFDRTANGIELRAVVDSSGNNYVNSNSFELWLPRKFDVQVSSSGGGIAIDNVEGRFAGNTGGGEITLDNVSGDASLTTGGGGITVTNSNLNGSVATGGGKALVTNTSGNVSVTSGSGPVIRDRVGQSGYSYNSAGGDIRLESVPNGGSFNTGGGAIVIGSVGGPASFSTGGGDVKISNVADDISVAAGVGSVEIRVISGNGTARNVSVATTMGRVAIELPSNVDARFDIESAYTERYGPTRIDSDFPMNVTETREWDSGHGTPRRYVRGSGSAGSGRGLIKIRTMNGHVVIRRRGEQHEEHKTYHLTAGAHIDVSNISGPVSVEATDGSSAEVHIYRTARNREDLAWRKVFVEQTSAGLTIRQEPASGEPDSVDLLNRVVLTLPRQVSVSGTSISGDVNVSGVTGAVALNGISGSVDARRLSGALTVSGVSGNVRVVVAGINDAGLRVSGVSGNVYLGLASGLNAELSVGDRTNGVSNRIQGLTLVSVGPSHYSARLGSGGPQIVVSNVTGTIVLMSI